MGWSTSAPTLPSGSSWAQKGTTSWENNHIRITSTVSVARLDGDQIAVRITETRTQIGTLWQTDNYMRVDVGGVTGTAYTTAWSANSGVAKSIYFTGTAAAGATIDVIVGYPGVSASLKTVSFTAPELLGNAVWVNVGGTWKKAKAVYVKLVSGVWTKARVKINVGGTWK